MLDFDDLSTASNLWKQELHEGVGKSSFVGDDTLSLEDLRSTITTGSSELYAVPETVELMKELV